MGKHTEVEKYSMIKIDEDDIEKLTEPNMESFELIAMLKL